MPSTGIEPADLRSLARRSNQLNCSCSFTGIDLSMFHLCNTVEQVHRTLSTKMIGSFLQSNFHFRSTNSLLCKTCATSWFHCFYQCYRKIEKPHHSMFLLYPIVNWHSILNFKGLIEPTTVSSFCDNTTCCD